MRAGNDALRRVGEVGPQAEEAPAEPADIAVVVKGPQQPIILREKQKVAGVWMNVESERFRSAPTFYAVASSRPLSQLVDERTAAIYELGLQNLQLSPGAGATPEERQRFESGLIDLMQRHQLFPDFITIDGAEGGTGAAPGGQRAGLWRRGQADPHPRLRVDHRDDPVGGHLARDAPTPLGVAWLDVLAGHQGEQADRLKERDIRVEMLKKLWADGLSASYELRLGDQRLVPASRWPRPRCYTVASPAAGPMF